MFAILKLSTGISIFRIVVVWALLWACSVHGLQPSAPIVRDDGWYVDTLSNAGFDLQKMQMLTEKLQSNGHKNAHIVVVEYDGKLVYEQYLSGEDQNWGTKIGVVQFDYDVKHDLRSISKSVTALLVGIALEQKFGNNFESALSASIMDYYPEYKKIVAPGVEKISLHHVLTMTDGLGWNEMDVPYSNKMNDEIQMYYSTDPFAYVLSKPVRTEPGGAWYYNGGTTMLLAGLIQKFTGKTFIDFAEEVLFKPLGITDYEWRGDNIWRKGLPSAASGLRLRARDLAKIGALMLHQGRWADKQVVPSRWIELSSIRHTEQTNSNWSMDGIYGYGYQWWHGNFRGNWDNATVVTGTGYGGQNLFVVPERNLVVTVFAGTYGQGGWTMPENILAEIISAAP